MAKLRAAPVPQGSWLEKFSPSCPDLLIHLFFFFSQNKKKKKRKQETFVENLGRNKWKKPVKVLWKT